MSNFKKMVQARIDKTGESWSTAAGHVRAAAGTGSTDQGTTAPVASGTFGSSGTSGPPDGDGISPGGGPAVGAFRGQHVTHYVFVDLDGGRRRLGVALSDPPGTGGFVIDTFEYRADALPAELLAEAERRNGPLRIQYPNGELGESFPATAAGVDEAHMMCGALAERGREIRLVTSRGVVIKHWNDSAEARVSRPSTGTVAFKYVHVDHGTQYGTVWRLSDDPDGASMRIPVPTGAMTPKVAEQAFARAVFPVIVETSADEGKTWVHRPDESPKRDWSGARALLYYLLGTGRWNAGRIRARTGEELVRHPPKLLKDIADTVCTHRAAPTYGSTHRRASKATSLRRCPVDAHAVAVAGLRHAGTAA
jgi:hypothetical protein